MRQRAIATGVRVTLLIAAASLTVVSLTGQVKDRPPAARTPWGDPDLQGVWNFSTQTPLERPKELGDKEVFTDPEEAARFLAAELRRANRDLAPEGDVGDYNEVWYDRGSTLVKTMRTSLVIDPPDGRIPPLTPEEQTRIERVRQARRGLDMDDPTSGGWVEDLGPGHLRARCILSNSGGPPMVPGVYYNNVQIVQAPGYVVLVNEMIHNARIVPLDGRAPSPIRRWLGSSRGRWEGETLVIETTNFLHETNFRYNARPSTNLRVIERLKRGEAGTLMYRATHDDPTIWTRPWTYELPMTKSSPQVIYEYACHEGNLTLANILSGARVREKAATNKQ